jgi:hypothetical protein
MPSKTAETVTLQKIHEDLAHFPADSHDGPQGVSARPRNQGELRARREAHARARRKIDISGFNHLEKRGLERYCRQRGRATYRNRRTAKMQHVLE